MSKLQQEIEKIHVCDLIQSEKFNIKAQAI